MLTWAVVFLIQRGTSLSGTFLIAAMGLDTFMVLGIANEVIK